MPPAVLITGANRGIGLEFARQYAAEGREVMACCRDPGHAAHLAALAKEHANVRIEALEVTDEKSIAALATKLKDEAIDILINNAGILSGTVSAISAIDKDPSQTFGSIDAEAWMKVMRTNALAPLKIGEAFVKQVATGEQRKLIMVSSGWGSIAQMDGGWYAYKLSKAALNAGVRNLAADLKGRDICVVAISPGWVATDMGSGHAEITPAVSVAAMRKTIAGLTPKQSGMFLDRNGKDKPW